MSWGLVGDEFEDVSSVFEDPPEDFVVCSVVLTVSEGKRLIAKGVATDARVFLAMEEGTVAVCKGTTNAYVLEELLGRDIEKGKYVLGNTVPATSPNAGDAFQGSIPEVVFHKGEPVEGLSVADAVKDMGPGDVVIKGANALDYPNQMAGLLIGHPAGGTLGSVLGSTYGKGLHLIIPVGLEKQVATPLKVSSAVAPALLAEHGVPRLWPFTGGIFTEIEAIQTLAEVIAMQIGAGGVCGAEGAIWLLIAGMENDVTEAKELIEQIQGEPSFWDAVMGQ